MKLQKLPVILALVLPLGCSSSFKTASSTKQTGAAVNPPPVPPPPPPIGPTFTWESSNWTSCTALCGGGTQTRDVYCIQDGNTLVADLFCSGVKPTTSQSCNTQVCASTCISSGSQLSINEALNGIGAKAVLCTNSIFVLTEPIKFTAANQEIYTEGNPTDGSRALIRVFL